MELVQKTVLVDDAAVEKWGQFLFNIIYFFVEKWKFRLLFRINFSISKFKEKHEQLHLLFVRGGS